MLLKFQMRESSNVRTTYCNIYRRGNFIYQYADILQFISHCFIPLDLRLLTFAPGMIKPAQPRAGLWHNWDSGSPELRKKNIKDFTLAAGFVLWVRGLVISQKMFSFECSFPMSKKNLDLASRFRCCRPPAALWTGNFFF